MKLAITKTDFPLGVRISRTSDGFRISWFSDLSKQDQAPTIEINEKFIRERCGSREVAEASNIYVEIDFSGNVTRVHNKMASTITDKSNGYEYALKNNTSVGAQVYIPFADSPALDWMLRVNGNPQIGIEVPADAVAVENNLHAFHEFAWSIYPSISVAETVARPDGSVEVHAQLMRDGKPIEKAGVRVFATSVTGYINKREVHTDAHGIAKVRARRLDLDKEDAMRVEFGFKFTKNICHADIP